MKKLISILLAMLMVVSTMSAFAAVEAKPGNGLAYYNTFAGIADYEVTSNAAQNPKNYNGNIGLNKDHPVDAVMSCEQLTVSRPAVRYNGEENKKTGLTFLYFISQNKGGITDDMFAIGFDFKLSGITSNTTNSVLTMSFGANGTAFDDTVQAKIDKGEYFIHTDGKAYAYTYAEDGSIVKDEEGNPVPNGYKGAKTGWRFFAAGSARPSFQTKKEADALVLGDNGKPAIYCGFAKLEQDKFYTFKMYVDQNAKTFNVVIVDGSGNVIDTGIKGKVQNACDNVEKLDIQLMASLNYEASITYDNIFWDSLDFAVIAPASFEPNEDNTVTFEAKIPDTVTSPAVYINDTFVENIPVVPGSTEYVVTSQLPAGTNFGDVKIEVRGTRDGEAVTALATTKYIKTIVRDVEIAYAESKITGTDVEGVPYYGSGDTRTKEFAAEVDGLYEVGFKLQRVSGKDVMAFRLKSNIVTTESGMFAVGPLIGSNKDVWNSLNLLSNFGIKADDFDWHDVSFLFDFRGNAMTGAQPYSITVDGKVTKTGTFQMDPRSTINGFVEIGIHSVLFKQVYLKELIEVGAKEVVANYLNGTTATYADEAISSVALENLTFALNTEFGNADAFSFVDENGNAVSGVTTAFNGNSFVVAPDANVVLAEGTYKLVIDKTATLSDGTTLGANIEVPVALKAPGSIISPAEEAVVTDSSTDIEFYVADAAKVAVYVNDEVVKTFDEPSENGFYTLNFAPAKVGKNYVDVYAYADNSVKLASSTFVWSPYKTFSEKKAMGATQNITAADSTYADGGVSKLYTATNRGGSPFVNLETVAGHRIGVREYDIKACENTWVYIELGLMTAPGAGTGSGNTYPNVTNIAGTSRYAIFDKNNKICGTEYTWEVGEWYHIKHIIDMENMTATVYVTHEDIGTDVMVLSTPITTKVLVDNKETAINYNKYRFIIKNISAESEVYSSVEIANPHTYELKSVPVASVEDETIIAGTDSVTVTLDKAYDALDPDFVFVTANSEEVDAVATVSEDGKEITVSGLADIKAGTRVEISVLEGSMFGGSLTDNDAIATVFVTDENGFCVFPVKCDFNGYNTTVFGKYLNPGASVKHKFVYSEYDNDDALKNVYYADAEFKSDENVWWTNIPHNAETSKSSMFIISNELSPIALIK